jgi:hypothetical protein
MRGRSLGIGGWLCAMQALVACNLTRDDPSTLHDLRVLAISATPPEILYRVHGDSFKFQCQPDLTGIQTSGTIDLRALVVDPLGNHRALGWVWTFCPTDFSGSNPTSRCPTDPAYVIARGTSDPSQIAAQWPLAQVALSEAASQQSCHSSQACPPTPLLSAFAQDSPGLCRFGIWLQIGLEIDAPDGQKIFASKLLVFTPVPDDYPSDPAVCPQGPGGGPPTHNNPVPVGLSLEGSPLDGGVTQVSGVGIYDVRPLPPDGGAQDYCVPDYSGAWRRLTETWLFSLTTTGGSFSSEEVGGAGGFFGTGFGATTSGPSTDLTVQWTTPSNSGPATFYEVTRDGRGGISWSSWQLQIP